MPFTVVACAEILLVNLERVGFNLRNFDMTIIYKVCDPLLICCTSDIHKVRLSLVLW